MGRKDWAGIGFVVHAAWFPLSARAGFRLGFGVFGVPFQSLEKRRSEIQERVQRTLPPQALNKLRAL